MPSPEQLAADSDDEATPATGMPAVEALAEQLAACKQQLDAMESATKELRQTYDELRKTRIPAALRDAGVVSARFPTLGTLSLRHRTHASVRADQQDEAREWCFLTGQSRFLTVSPAMAQALANTCIEAGKPLPGWISTYSEEIATITRSKTT